MCFVVFVSKLYRYNNVILLTKNISTIEIYESIQRYMKASTIAKQDKKNERENERERERKIETPKIMN